MPPLKAAGLPSIVQLIEEAQELRRQRLPQNWPKEVRSRLFAARSIIEADGIPLVYVPRAEIVGLVFDAPTRADRIKVLMAHSTDVLDDCDNALAPGDLHPSVERQVPLVRQAIEAWRSGYAAASQALSVVVCDTLIRANIHFKHTSAKASAGGADLRVAMAADILRLELSVAPVVRFLTEWSPESRKPEPTDLSRHVTVHHATTGQLREDNALVAAMLATGLIRGFSEMHQWSDARPKMSQLAGLFLDDS
ncbi:hypothetical protein A5684_22010 [Mycobacterium intracellulare]|nr:hypothetical protein A5684_22010 [Mycobacterium intracellulare]